MPIPIRLYSSRNSRYVPSRSTLSTLALSFILFTLAGKNVLASPSVVQTAANSASSATSSFPITFPNSTRAGDTILVGFDFVASASVGSVSDSQGNPFSEVGAQLTSPGGARSRVYFANNIKGGSDTVTVTLTSSSAYVEVYVTEFTGVNQNNPIDAQAGATGYAGSVSSGNATTTQAGDAIYGFCVGDNACTAGSGFTALSNLHSNLSEEQIVGNAGSYAATGNANSSWTMQMVALKPAASQPTVLQAITSAASWAASSLSVALPQNTLAGDTILVAFDFDTNTSVVSVSDSQGNPFSEVGTQLTSALAVRSRVYFANNIRGGSDTVTIKLNAASAYLEVYVTEFTGVSQTNPIDAQAGATGSAGSVSSGYATTSQASDAIYGFCIGDVACTAGSGFTTLSNLHRNLSEEQIVGNAGSYAATGYATSSWTMQMVALKPGTSGGASGIATTPGPSSPGASVSATNLAFVTGGVGIASAAQTITLTNTGGVAMAISSIRITGSNAADFVDVTTCGGSLSAGASCNIVIVFTPTLVGSAETATLTVTDNASGGSQSVVLSGTGSHDVVVTWTASPTSGVGYYVYRGTAPGQESSTPLNYSPVYGSPYTDVNVSAGVTYYYVVRVELGSSLSAVSNEAKATVP
jgi:hypothetical protein